MESSRIPLIGFESVRAIQSLNRAKSAGEICGAHSKPMPPKPAVSGEKSSRVDQSPRQVGGGARGVQSRFAVAYLTGGRGCEQRYRATAWSSTQGPHHRELQASIDEGGARQPAGLR